MAPPEELPFSNLLERVTRALPPRLTVYLVGGAVRDALMQRENHDMDFALAGDVLATGRRVANALGAAYYPLDEERDTARLILELPGGDRQVLDFAALRGPDLESDLRARDFTINALALDIHQPTTLIDPLGGAADLREKVLRACSPSAFQDDPLRILRGVRQASAFGFHIEPATRQAMRQAVELLPRVSMERKRDELFRILDGPQPAATLRALDMLGALEPVLPEMMALKGVAQSLPHVNDVWNHTLDVVQRLGGVLRALSAEYDPETAANWALGMVSVRLGRFRQQIGGHLASPLNPERSHRSLLYLAALYHDISKPETVNVEESGRIRFFEHEDYGARRAGERARRLRLSNDEIERVKTIVKNHMRPFLLAQTGEPPTRRAIYRFFRAAGPAGVDVCLLSLADALGTYGPTLPQDAWVRLLDVVRLMLEAWWERPEEAVSPPAVLNGNDLMETFGLPPGRHLGELLEAVREAQATGEISDREAALAFVRERLDAA